VVDVSLLAPGHRTCSGCGPAIAIRNILEATGDDIIIANATGCLEVTTTPYPETSWKVPWVHCLFENAAAVASGIESAMKAIGNTKTKVIALGGDGGMLDIGFQCVSGALERGHKISVICYDNEAYMNTGVQRSGSTPYGASTTTSPPGKMSIGNDTFKKDVVAIAAAHHIPYVATASIAYPADLKAKVKKALELQPSFLQIHSPCPVGWGFDSSKTIEIAKLAVDSGAWNLFEIENNQVKNIFKPKETKPVAEYLKTQKRFKHLKPEDIAKIQSWIDDKKKQLVCNIP